MISFQSFFLIDKNSSLGWVKTSIPAIESSRLRCFESRNVLRFQIWESLPISALVDHGYPEVPHEIMLWQRKVTWDRLWFLLVDVVLVSIYESGFQFLRRSANVVLIALGTCDDIYATSWLAIQILKNLGRVSIYFDSSCLRCKREKTASRFVAFGETSSWCASILNWG